MWVHAAIQRGEPRDALRAKLLLLGELLRPMQEHGIEVDEGPVEVKEGEALHDATLGVSILAVMDRPVNRAVI